MKLEEAIGSLQAHEERLKGQNITTRKSQSTTTENKLLLTEEEWSRREKNECKILLTLEEWIKRKNKENTEEHSSYKRRGRRGFQGTGRDRDTVRCFNCNILGHYAAECKRPRRERNQRPEANLVQIKDDEPALLLSKLDEKKSALVLLNEENVVPKMEMTGKEKKISQLWYLDNDASNHMTRD